MGLGLEITVTLPSGNAAPSAALIGAALTRAALIEPALTGSPPGSGAYVTSPAAVVYVAEATYASRSLKAVSSKYCCALKQRRNDATHSHQYPPLRAHE